MNHWNKWLLGFGLIAVSAWASADALQVLSLAASCAGCHGTDDVAQQGMESLTGQSKDALFKKLLEFRTGTKPATVMHQLSKGYSDEQLEQLAGYFSAVKK